MPTFTADSVVAARRFTADAWIMGERWQHHRQRDHFGSDSDLYVVLSEAIGPYPALTPIHHVLEDFEARLAALEDSERTVAAFTADAILAGYAFLANAIVRKSQSASLTANAVITRGGSFTIDAFIPGAFTIDAFIV